MKWTIIVAIIVSSILTGLYIWLFKPEPARAFEGQYETALYLQDDATPTPSVTPTATATPTPYQNDAAGGIFGILNGIPPIYLPFIRLDPSPTATPIPLPPKEFLVCSSPGKAIPDGTGTGLRADIALNEPGVLLDLDVYVRINHTYVGDLALEIVQRGPDNSTVIQSSILVDRPGLANDMLAINSTESLGCDGDNLQSIFDSQAEQYAENKCQYNSKIGVAVGGTFKAKTGLDQFRGQPASGPWSLLVSDNAVTDTGTLQKWCLHGWAAGTAAPVVPPTPISLPATASVTINGFKQSRNLSCESRSAVDWAKFFGKTIGEIEFLSKLPISDNPDVGFVGNVDGTWGQIPPNDYGVHAEPVARLLRAYGLKADARKGLRFDELRAEIANGRPVIVWITGNVERSAPEYYRAQSDQGISIVARYEHTVIVYGYDANYVYVQNGGLKDTIDIDRFLDSWSALGNMAVLAQP